jgi:4-amino-4-deoxy-L-arabinose transferase-like glycosyltransferase
VKLWRDRQSLPLLLLAGVIFILCLYVRWRLLEVPLERDEGEYAYMGQLLLQGIPPYLQAYTMKLPGVSVAYALIMLLFGQTLFGIHLGLLLVNVANTLLVGLLARRLFNPRAALAAAASYALLALSQSVLGVFAHATHFVVLFALAGLLLLLRHFDTGKLPALCGAGICLGLAITMKQHAVLIAGFAVLYHAWRTWRRPPGDGRSLWVTGGWLLLCIALPLLLLALWMALAGVFQHFWFWTVRYASAYASSLPLNIGVSILGRMLSKLWDHQPLLWLLAGAGFCAVLVRPRVCADRLLLFGLLASSFLAICPGFYFRNHYFVLLLPAIALLVGGSVAATEDLLAKARQGWLPVAVPCLLLTLAAGWGIYRERAYLLEFAPMKVSRETYGQNPFPESLEIARYLAERTTAEDRIAVLGSEPQIYFYANRRSATGHIYMYGLMELHRDAFRMQQEMIGEIEAARPEYIVIVNLELSWLTRPRSKRLILEWADSYLDALYDEVGKVMIYPDRTEYYFDEDLARVDPRMNAELLIYRRKG